VYPFSDWGWGGIATLPLYTPNLGGTLRLSYYTLIFDDESCLFLKVPCVLRMFQVCSRINILTRCHYTYDLHDNFTHSQDFKTTIDTMD
jgi:hypothetical protein